MKMFLTDEELGIPKFVKEKDLDKFIEWEFLLFFNQEKPKYLQHLTPKTKQKMLSFIKSKKLTYRQSQKAIRTYLINYENAIANKKAKELQKKELKIAQEKQEYKGFDPSRNW